MKYKPFQILKPSARQHAERMERDAKHSNRPDRSTKQRWNLSKPEFDYVPACWLHHLKENSDE
jgi:hypothetical protein